MTFKKYRDMYLEQIRSGGRSTYNRLNTLGKTIKVIKTVMRCAEEEG